MFDKALRYFTDFHFNIIPISGEKTCYQRMVFLERSGDDD